MFVGIKPYGRLQKGRSDLQYQCDGSNLRKCQIEVGLEYGENGRNHRLHRVIEQMTEADDEEYAISRLANTWCLKRFLVVHRYKKVYFSQQE